MRAKEHMRANERKGKFEKERKSLLKSAKGRKRALPHKNCKRPGLKQPELWELPIFLLCALPVVSQVGVKLLDPFLAWNRAEKPTSWGANLKEGQRDPHAEGGKTAENRTLADVNRRYFGICGRFSAVNRRWNVTPNVKHSSFSSVLKHLKKQDTCLKNEIGINFGNKFLVLLMCMTISLSEACA